jgi:hypothetical protein
MRTSPSISFGCVSIARVFVKIHGKYVERRRIINV